MPQVTSPSALAMAQIIDVEAQDTVRRALEAVRTHLGMEIAYVSEIIGDRSIFREVDAPGYGALLKPGDSVSLDDVCCRHILEGRLPQMIPDASQEPLAASLPLTSNLPVGAHMSVPITLPNGRTYGMFCCLSTTPDTTLNERDLNMMKAVAAIAAIQIGRDQETQELRTESIARIIDAMDSRAMTIVYQPIVRLRDDRVAGFECLARFAGPDRRSPDLWFKEAAGVGLGVELELRAIQEALVAIDDFPAHVFLSVNASPQTVISGRIHEAFGAHPLSRIVLEVTEHDPVVDYRKLRQVLDPLRKSGLRVAIDDAGSGFSGLRHMVDTWQRRSLPSVIRRAALS